MSLGGNRKSAWSILLPLKELSTGKSRLNVPTDADRIALIKAMACDLIDALLSLDNVASITVVGVNHRDLSAQGDNRLDSYLPEVPSGINCDLSHAIGNSGKIGAILPDLPAVTSEEIAIALELAEGHTQSYIPDYTDVGTAAYFSTSREYFSPQFGGDSSRSHSLKGAYKLSHPTFWGIRRDCDNLTDLLGIPLSSLGVATRSALTRQMRN